MGARKDNALEAWTFTTVHVATRENPSVEFRGQSRAEVEAQAAAFDAEQARKADELKVWREQRKSLPPAPAPRLPKWKPLPPIEEPLSEADVVALGWTLDAVAEPREETLDDGRVAFTKAKVAARKRLPNGAPVTQLATGRTVDAARADLFEAIRRQENGWREKEYGPYDERRALRVKPYRAAVVGGTEAA
jgi:hypothetical protein